MIFDSFNLKEERKAREWVKSMEMYESNAKAAFSM